MMKKICALLLALCLTLTAATALAATQDINFGDFTIPLDPETPGKMVDKEEGQVLMTIYPAYLTNGEIVCPEVELLHGDGAQARLAALGVAQAGPSAPRLLLLLRPLHGRAGRLPQPGVDGLPHRRHRLRLLGQHRHRQPRRLQPLHPPDQLLLPLPAGRRRTPSDKARLRPAGRRAGL